jgi:DHA1 family bicyclomycin/chloramphenicol resistance-like MFS transporter
MCTDSSTSTPAALMKRITYVSMLCGLAAIGPFSIDTYVPVLPSMASEFQVAGTAVQLTLTSYVAGLLIGVVFVGSLSDAVGRRGPLLWGLAVYTAASLLCAASPTVTLLSGARALQALGAAAATVIARAVVRDEFSGVAVTRLLSSLTLVQGLAPTVAPLVGSQLLHLASWRGIFVFLGVAGGGLLLAAARTLPESLPVGRRTTPQWRAVGKSYVALFRDQSFIGHAATFAAAFGVLFAYVSTSPFVLQDLHGLTALQFSFVYGVNGVGMVVAGQLNARVVGRVREQTLLQVGLCASVTGGAAALVATALGGPLWIVLAALFAVVASIGLIMPNATSLALRNHRNGAGTAFSLLTVVQLTIAGFASWVAGTGSGTDAGISMTATMAVLSAVSVIIFGLFQYTNRNRSNSHDTATIS